MSTRDALRMSHLRMQQRCHDAEAHVDRLLAENQQLRSALEEAVNWLDSDLATAPDTATSMADRELIRVWRAALDGTS